MAIGLLGWLSAVSGDRGLGLQSSRLFCSLSLSLNENNCLNLFSDNTEDPELDDLFKFLLRFWSVILHGSRHIASHFMVLSLTRKFQQKFHQTRFLFTKYPFSHILEYPYFQFLDRYVMSKISNRVDGCWFSLNQLTVGDLSWQPSWESTLASSPVSIFGKFYDYCKMLCRESTSRPGWPTVLVCTELNVVSQIKMYCLIRLVIRCREIM